MANEQHITEATAAFSKGLLIVAKDIAPSEDSETLVLMVEIAVRVIVMLRNPKLCHVAKGLHLLQIVLMLGFNNDPSALIVAKSIVLLQVANIVVQTPEGLYRIATVEELEAGRIP